MAKKITQKTETDSIRDYGDKCAHCGLTLEDVNFCHNVFDVDEIKPLDIGKRKFSSMSLKRLEEAKKFFLEGKIQLLCSNCSRIKTWKNNEYARRFKKV